MNFGFPRMCRTRERFSIRREYGGVILEQSFSGRAVCVARCLHDGMRLCIVADLRAAFAAGEDMSTP